MARSADEQSADGGGAGSKPLRLHVRMSLRLRSSAEFDAAACFASLKLDAEASISEEPGARKPHAGICFGAIG